MVQASDPYTSSASNCESLPNSGAVHTAKVFNICIDFYPLTWGEINFFMPPCQRQPWLDAFCFQIVHPSVPFLWMQYLRNALREFHYIWDKCPIGLKDELIRIWESMVRGHCDLIKHVFWLIFWLIKATVGRIEKIMHLAWKFERVQLPGFSPLTLVYKSALASAPSSRMRGGMALPAAWAGDTVRLSSCSDWLFDPGVVDSCKWP